MEKNQFRAMGSNMMAALDADGPRAQEALAHVPDWFETWEQHLSRFRPDSELNDINSRSGQWVGVSPIMWEVLLAAQRAEQISDGLVTPALQGALAAMGYDREFDLVATFGADLQVAELEVAPLPRMGLQLDRKKRRIWLPEGRRLDLGGIAKGWAADKALQGLDTYGAGLVDAGGDVAARQPKMEFPAWPVGVTDPFEPEATLTLLALRDQAVATSGRDFHHWEQGGEARHHILDPRSGLPAASRVLSATVVAPTAVDAEVGAKCALILGEVEGLAWINDHPSMAGLLVLDDGTITQSDIFEQFLWSE
jgi:thiamine biosynthesis lipoprotein